MARSVNDGILHARMAGVKECELCTLPALGIELIEIDLPEGIELGRTILASRLPDTKIEFVGISCGCYAKFHRQVAHISTTMKLRKKS